MSMPSTKTMLFNAAASVVAIFAVVGVVRTWLAPSTMQSCSERYSTSMVFPLERDGVVLTATDIQARTGGRDAGLIENVDVIRLKRGPVPIAMSVELPERLSRADLFRRAQRGPQLALAAAIAERQVHGLPQLPDPSALRLRFQSRGCASGRLRGESSSRTTASWCK